MKFYKIKYILLLCASLGIFSSCEDFLDRQEDEVMTFDKIWEKRGTTRQYFLNAMSWIPDYNTYSTEKPWYGASDEGSVSYAGSVCMQIIHGTWNASSFAGEYANLYKGIRECNIFLANIDRCKDPELQNDEKESWRAGVRWARAYYYFMLMRSYGPIILIGDEITDPTIEAPSDMARARNTWDECVAYVKEELNEVIDSEALLYNNWDEYDDRKGLPTEGAAKALLSRLMLYNARPLFNGCEYYKDVSNQDGTRLFPQNTNDNKWKDAADAAYRVISEGNYELYKKGDGSDPYANWKGLNISGATWHKEVIYGRYNTCNYWARRATPSSPTLHGYSGVGPTQEQVDAYAMNNGRFPITGYTEDGTPIIDETSGYTEDGTSDFANPYSVWKGIGTTFTRSADGKGWPNMYKAREPRFYMSVFWSNSYWIYNKNKTEAISMAKGGNSYNSHNYSLTGYTMIRYVDSDYNHANTVYNATVYSQFRFAEIYMNFIEAVLECKKRGVTVPDNYETLAFKYWDEIRDRVGIPHIKVAYPEVTNSDYDKWIDLCRRERRVEFVGEHLRYFDNRTWMISDKVDKGFLHGMNVEAPAPSAQETPEEFWQRTPLKERLFETRYYLYPIPQDAIRKNLLLVQNKGW